MATMTSSYDAQIGTCERMTIGKYVLYRHDYDGSWVVMESIVSGETRRVRAWDLEKALNAVFAGAGA